MTIPPCQPAYNNQTETFMHYCQDNESPVYKQEQDLSDKKLEQLEKIQGQLHEFILSCHHTINDLNSALNTERMDALTSNSSFFGFFIAQSSYHKNLQVADKVDRLREQALSINHLIRKTNLKIFPLYIDFYGNAIRSAEHAEHNFFANLFTSHTYSSYASFDTMNQLQHTKEKISRIIDQATEMGAFLI